MAQPCLFSSDKFFSFFYNMKRLGIFQIFELWLLLHNSFFNPSLSFLPYEHLGRPRQATPALDPPSCTVLSPSTKHDLISQLLYPLTACLSSSCCSQSPGIWRQPHQTQLTIQDGARTHNSLLANTHGAVSRPLPHLQACYRHTPRLCTNIFIRPLRLLSPSTRNWVV